MKLYNQIFAKQNPTDRYIPETGYYKWLELNYTDNALDDITSYLESFGFHVGVDGIHGRYLQEARYIHNAYFHANIRKGDDNNG